ncbi:hypothetical protein R3X40_25650, partial [Salmonella enterica subsp. enterica serovar Agona]|uniref:hypothetical protein n=1 Tax=Salmonella enterica TaxID=28901 RepID=UPI002A764B4F
GFETPRGDRPLGAFSIKNFTDPLIAEALYPLRFTSLAGFETPRGDRPLGAFSIKNFTDPLIAEALYPLR